MEAILQWMINVPTEIMHTVGYGVLFLATICESVPPLGMIIPGQTIVITGGFLSSIEVFSSLIVFACASLGMWLGMIISYHLGKKYGAHFLQRYGKYLLISDKVLESIQALVHKNWRWGLILSEYYGWTRGLFPFMTGVAKIPFRGFLVWSLLAAIAWGAIFTAIGYFVGESYELVAASMGKFLTWGIVAGIAIAVLFRYFKNEEIPLKKGFSRMVIADVIAILLFSLIAQRIHLDKTSFVGIDMWFLHFFAQFPMMDTLMIWISQVFNLWFIGAIAILILGYLYRKKLFYYATVFISSMMCVLVAFPLLKLLIQRVRPSTALLTLNDFSFPSGHAAMSIVFCLLCWYVVHDQIEKKRIKYSFLVLMIACTGMIGISRLFLHVHRFTDVVAGFLLGFSLLATNILVWDIIFKTHLEGKKVIEKGSKKQLIDILL